MTAQHYEPPDFTIVGAGLAGAVMAAYLGQAGRSVELFERRADPRRGGYAGGRSINLALSTRGIHALREIGVADEVLAQAVPMRGRMIHARDGRTVFQPYDKDPTRCINSVSRGGLNVAVLNALQKCPSVRVHFGRRCVDADLDAPAAELVSADESQRLRSSGRVLIAADGAFSAIRGAMQRRERFNYSQTYEAHGYKELTIPPAAAGGFRLEANALHIWPRHSYMMIALPNHDGSYTCTLFWPLDGPHSFDALRSDDDVRRYFECEFPDAVPHMPTLVDDYRHNPVGVLMTVRCGPWFHRDKVVMLGDAAHAVVPFYGQGMNCAFEDCSELAACLRRSGPDLTGAFQSYYLARKENADALADLAVANFVEMRDKTASRAFRAYKRIDRTLHALLPGWYTPLYTMVSFTRIPYAEARRRAARQDRVVVTLSVALVVLLLYVLWLGLRKFVA